MATELLLIDDDDLSREVLALLFEDAGYTVQVFASGDLALEHLRGRPLSPLAAVLTDLQMPGTSGPALARELRGLLPEGVPVVAMSGSRPTVAETEGFSGFLLKPLTPADLDDLLQRVRTRAHGTGVVEREAPREEGASAERPPVLDEKTFSELSLLLRPEQMREFLALCFSEIVRYTGAIREALDTGDVARVRTAAHSLKGSVAMMGAREVQALAGCLESGDMGSAYQRATLGEIEPAAERLRRMLVSRGYRFADLAGEDAHEDTTA